MTTTPDLSAHTGDPDVTQPVGERITRVSTRFGIAFTVCQLAVMVLMATLVLPHGGSPSDPPLPRGQNVFDAETAYRLGNMAFMMAGTLLLGFLGAVYVRLKRADASGVLATVGVASGTLLALIWPMAGMLHDVALETASAGTDLRILAGWDSVAPYALAFSALPRLFFIAAIAFALRLEGAAPGLQRIGIALLPLSLVGSATMVTGAVFPVLALSTLGYELWIAAVAWHWLRSGSRRRA
jgi:hypothetical protein